VDKIKLGIIKIEVFTSIVLNIYVIFEEHLRNRIWAL